MESIRRLVRWAKSAVAPASSETLADFIDAQAALKKVATVKRYLTTIATAHRAAGRENPVRHEFVRLAVRRMARKHGIRQEQAKGFNWPHIHLALSTLDVSPRVHCWIKP
ncbi:MAG: hypothetical protein ACXV7F_14090 [Methylomonas sp.]